MKWSCPAALGRPLTVDTQTMTPVTVKGIDFTGSTSTFSTAITVEGQCTNSPGAECRHGGAIMYADTVVSSAVALNVVECNFTSNSIEFDGGAIFFQSGGKLRLQDVWFQGNQARRGVCAPCCASSPLV